MDRPRRKNAAEQLRITLDKERENDLALRHGEECLVWRRRFCECLQHYSDCVPEERRVSPPRRQAAPPVPAAIENVAVVQAEVHGPDGPQDAVRAVLEALPTGHAQPKAAVRRPQTAKMHVSGAFFKRKFLTCV